MRRLYKLLGGLSLVMLLSIATLFPAITSAFSAYGAGTAGNPYRIATCSQLQEINNNLSAYYELVSDINCNGATINTIGAGVGDFSGIFNGNNHTITNFINNGTGLFNASNGATFENLSVTDGTINTTGWAGGLVGEITGNTIINNVHTKLTINNASTGYTGGLVGLDLSGTISINQSSFSGSISNGSSYEGGLVGAIDVAGSTVTNSYATGTFNMSSDVYNGGIVGALFGSATLTNVYSAFALNVSGTLSSGGIVGSFNHGSIVNSFAANTLSGSGTNIGAVTGVDNNTATNVHYDSSLAGGLGCSGDGSVSCTAENVSNAAPNYFKSNTSNGPLNTWDFGAIWKTNNGGYPTLQNEAAFTPASVPNSGDANGDGIADSYQANVASIKDANGVWSTITIPDTGGCTLDSPASVDANAIKTDSSFSAMVKYDAFTVYCPTAGAIVPVTIIYDKQYNTAGAVLRYYNPTTKAYSTVAGAVFGTTVIGGVTKTTVTYNLTDGSSLDNDGVSNGVIVDPVAMVALVGATAAPNTGFGAPGNHRATSGGLTLLAAISLASGLYLTRRQKRGSSL